MNAFRLEGEGWVGGGVTVKPRKTITIHRGRLGLDSAAVSVGPEVVADDLSINGDVRIEPFPDRGAKFGDVIGGISGTLSIAGRIGEKAAVKQEITPGITTVGAGSVTANLRFKNGVLRAGSQYSLHSDAFHLRIMDLDATGSAEISGRTAKEGGDHVTSMNVSFGDFEFVDPEDESADITGTGLELNARWNGLSLAGEVPASHVDLVMPAVHIHDVAAFNGLIPGEHTLSLESGTGEARARLEVNQRLAVGTLDLTAEDIVMQAQDVPLRGNLEVHANLGDGNLSRKEFDISGTTIRLDHIVGEDLSPKQEKNLGAWYCDVELRKGTVTLGKPLEADGQIRMKMYDTRPVVAMLREFGTGPKWLSMMPNVKDVEATMDVGVGKGRTAVDDLVLTGNKLEVLGWIHIQDKKANGRLLIEYGILSAGVALEEGKGTVRISKPRKWFEEQPKSPQGAGGSAPADGS